MEIIGSLIMAISQSILFYGKTPTTISTYQPKKVTEL